MASLAIMLGEFCGTVIKHAAVGIAEAMIIWHQAKDEYTRHSASPQGTKKAADNARKTIDDWRKRLLSERVADRMRKRDEKRGDVAAGSAAGDSGSGDDV